MRADLSNRDLIKTLFHSAVKDESSTENTHQYAGSQYLATSLQGSDKSDRL